MPQEKPKSDKQDDVRAWGDWPNYDYIVGEDYAVADVRSGRAAKRSYFRLHVDIPVSKNEARELGDLLDAEDYRGVFDFLVNKTNAQPGTRGHDFLKASFGQ